MGVSVHIDLNKEEIQLVIDLIYWYEDVRQNVDGLRQDLKDLETKLEKSKASLLS
tara:strand:+ start:4477 stop:4641 length:165 start_codon:yes stop_codon:yes gene_type:complete